jgi:site-specific recombinase XerD
LIASSQSFSTEKTYVHWVRRYILFHKAKQGIARHPKEMGAGEVQAFVTHLALEEHISASTQNLALSAILFLYRHVLQIDIEIPNEILRAEKSKTIPVVLTHAEAMKVIAKMNGVTQLMAKNPL